MFGLSLKGQRSILPQIIKRLYCDPSSRERWADLDDEEKERVRKSRKLKAWKGQRTEADHYLQALNIGTNRHGIFMNKGTIKLTEWISWYERKQIEYLRWSQRYIPERQEVLGNDLGLAHFIVHRNGRVRRKGSTEFIGADDILELPNKYIPTWFLEEVDASGTELCYEGIENFTDTSRLKIAAFRNCKNFDDWCLERLLCLCPNLQVLDVSDNEKITERGLEGVYRAWNLEKLIVTDWGHGAAFELTCIMLEEVLPKITIEIKKPNAEHLKSNENPAFIAESTAPTADQVVK